LGAVTLIYGTGMGRADRLRQLSRHELR
jgi:hypothetical protein